MTWKILDPLLKLKWQPTLWTITSMVFVRYFQWKMRMGKLSSLALKTTNFSQRIYGNYSVKKSWIWMRIMVCSYLLFSRNGRWRSVWTVQLENGQAEVQGLLKVQVHYYEDGNIQLVSSKEVKEGIACTVKNELSLLRVWFKTFSFHSLMNSWPVNWCPLWKVASQSINRPSPRITRPCLKPPLRPWEDNCLWQEPRSTGTKSSVTP